MIKNIFKCFFWVLTVTLMIGIFCFSSQQAEESQQTSRGLTKKVLSASKEFRELPEEKQDEIVVDLQFFVRKTAHFSIYSALGISLLSALLLTFNKKFLWVYALLGCFLYAVSDEVHQSLVAGRSCEVRDVLIDTLGAFLGIGIVMLIRFIYLQKKLKQNEG